MVNYIFDPEEKEYITVTRPYPYSVGYHGKPLFPAEIYRRRAKTKSQSGAVDKVVSEKQQ